MKIKSILLTAMTLSLLLNGCVREIGGAVSYMATGTDYVSGIPEANEKKRKELAEKARLQKEYDKTPEGQAALRKQQADRQRLIDAYGCKVKNTITHNNAEIGRVATRTWYDPAGKRYRHSYTTYLECRDCGHRSTGSTGD